MTGFGLSLWVVYDHPRDLPDVFVAREHVATEKGSAPTANVVCSNDLALLRQALEKRGLTPMARDPDDDPAILEVWL